uniref:BTB domain-containing protein n=1 Tax=Caenorhabditis japonica TaxID=281687 RepID=A0A8R1IQE7_CAEJA
NKVTFSVELRLEWDKEVPFELGHEISFPNANFALKVGEDKLMVDQEYLKRRVPLLAYMFDEEEKKEFAVDDVDFQSLVDVFGALQHHWPFSADRLHQLILIARRLGFDLWGPALSREFAQLVYRNEPVKIVAM